MSAFICDPRHVDYLVTWAHRPRAELYVVLNDGETPPEPLRHAVSPGKQQWQTPDRLMLREINPTDLGRLLMAENVRSVMHRYDDTAPDDLPGPNDQRGVFAYAYRPIPHTRADWTVSACHCWQYQTCETPDHAVTLAWRVVEAIERHAVSVLTENAPWEITEETLNRPVRQVVR